MNPTSVCDCNGFKIGDLIQIGYRTFQAPGGTPFSEISPLPTNDAFEATVVHKLPNNTLLVGWSFSTHKRLNVVKPANSLLNIMNARHASLALAGTSQTIPTHLDLFWLCNPKSTYFFKLGEAETTLVMKTAANLMAEGSTCEWCDNFFPMSEPNQKDGSFKCYGCRGGGRIRKMPRFC